MKLSIIPRLRNDLIGFQQFLNDVEADGGRLAILARAEGYTEGFTQGFAEGQQKGLLAGRLAGFEDGYHEGLHTQIKVVQPPEENEDE